MLKVQTLDTSSCKASPNFQKRIEEAFKMAGLEGTFRLIIIGPKDVICEEESTVNGATSKNAIKYLTVFDLCAKTVTRARYTLDGYHSTENAYLSETMLSLGSGMKGEEIPEPLRDKMKKISDCVEKTMTWVGPQ